MKHIEPIGKAQKQQVIDKAEDYIQQLNAIHKIDIPSIDIDFDLKGRAAGMYVVKNKQRKIRFNPYIFAKYFNDSLVSTVPHEIAHYTSDIIYGLSNIKPHGHEWRSIMLSINAEPRVTGNYDLSGVPVKKQKRFDYQCQCMSHQLTAVRHNRIKQGKAYYLCKKCKTPIICSE